MRLRSEALTLFALFVTEFNLYGMHAPGALPRRVGALHADNAGEFTSREFKEYCDTHSIAFTSCPAHTHPLNGVAERAVGTIVTVLRTALIATAVHLLPSGRTRRHTSATF